MKTLKVTLQCGWMDSARQYSTGPNGVGQCPVLIIDPASQSTTLPLELKKHVHSGDAYSILLARACSIALSFASSSGFASFVAFETTITLRQSETTIQASASPRMIEMSEGRYDNASDVQDVGYGKELNCLLNSWLYVEAQALIPSLRRSPVLFSCSPDIMVWLSAGPTLYNGSWACIE